VVSSPAADSCFYSGLFLLRPRFSSDEHGWACLGVFSSDLVSFQIWFLEPSMSAVRFRPTIFSTSSVCGGVSWSFLRVWSSPIHPCWYVQGLMQCQGSLGGLGDRDSLHPLRVCGVVWMLGFSVSFLVGSVTELWGPSYGHEVLILFVVRVNTLRFV
jgi:hypothetical protein